jgi:hypothetical protein
LRSGYDHTDPDASIDTVTPPGRLIVCSCTAPTLLSTNSVDPEYPYFTLVEVAPFRLVVVDTIRSSALIEATVPNHGLT